jgi:kynurenine formamidase
LLDHEESRPDYDGKAEFYLGTMEMPGNLGTYIDSPFHRYPDRPDLSRLPLESVAGLPGVVLDGILSGGRALDIDCESGELGGQAVLLRTGWDSRWGTGSYWEPGPYLSDATVSTLVRSGAALVGVDFWNVDDTSNPYRPAHTKLLASEIPVVENLCNLSSIPASGFRFYAVPLRIAGGASVTVRAFAETP